MPVETFGFLNSLVATNPASSDGLVNGDDHIRGIKLALGNTFPGLGTPITRIITGGNSGLLIPSTYSSAAPPLAFAEEPTLGFYRAGLGKIGFTGRLTGHVLPAGTIIDFGGPGIPEGGWLQCDGTTLSQAAFPDLYAAIGTYWGYPSVGTFKLPNFSNRYRRMAGVYAGAIGTYQDPNVGLHAHTFAATTGTESNDHFHSGSGTTGGQTVSHTHNMTTAFTFRPVDGGGTFSALANQETGGANLGNTGAASNDHAHPFSFSTGGRSAVHTHNVSGTTASSGGPDYETRPFSASVLTYIKY